MKITNEDFRIRSAWEKHILDPSNCPQLPKGHKRPTLILYCFAMASHGRSGHGCFAADSTIGREIGIANRNIVAKYRRLALKLGWFEPAVREDGSPWRVKRSEVLDIAIPSPGRVAEDTRPLEDTPDKGFDPRHDYTFDELGVITGGHTLGCGCQFCSLFKRLRDQESDPWAA